VGGGRGGCGLEGGMRLCKVEGGARFYHRHHSWGSMLVGLHIMFGREGGTS
jgi:hypothetical protein